MCIRDRLRSLRCSNVETIHYCFAIESDPIFFYMDLSQALGNGISNVNKIHAKQVLFAKFQLIGNFLDLQNLNLNLMWRSKLF